VRAGVASVAALLGLAVAAALWAAQPWADLPEVVPSSGTGAARAGSAIAVAGVVLLAAVAAALTWAARRNLDRALRLLLRAAVAFGLLLLLVPLVLLAPDPVPAAAAWLAAIVAAGEATWLLRRPGWPSWTAAALAAGGFAGMAAGVAGLAVLAIVCAAVALYDAWAVRRHSMVQAAAVSDRMSLPLTVGTARGGLSLGLGDLLLPAAVLAAAAAYGAWPLALAAAGLAAGFAALAAGVRHTDLPGIPFLCGGALAGAAAGLLAL
jgi:presenilin-like A22 family membrane protease